MTDTIPRAKLALWAGWRYYRRLALEYPEDFQQAAALLALSSVEVSDDKEAFRLITRGFARVCRSYGYRYHPQAGWIRGESYASVRPAYLCKCGRKSFSAKHCGACRSREYRERGPKARKERAPKSPPLWNCANCGKSFEKAKRRMRSDQNIYFCSTACYHDARSREVWRLTAQANITRHAVERFCERVIAWRPERALAAIRRGLSKPIAMIRKRKGWEATCRIGALEFRVHLKRNAENSLDAVTVLESRADNDQMRAERRSRRDESSRKS
jgi:hypothetical protein